jgi:hypothetical protein
MTRQHKYQNYIHYPKFKQHEKMLLLPKEGVKQFSV